MNNDGLTLTISTGRSRKETDWKVRQTTWGRLAEKLSSPKRTPETVREYTEMSRDDRGRAKDVGGFVGGEIAGGNRRSGNVRSRQILALDIDYGAKDTWTDYEMMCDWECLMHTTHSHTPEKPRYRMYFPLARPVAKDEYEPVARKVAEQIDMELFDDTTYQAARLMYWPSCPADGEFLVWRHRGRLVDPDEILSWYSDWHDISEWPVSGRTIREIHQSAEKQQSPYSKGGIIGAFCRAYDIPSAIDKYLPDVYEPVESDPRRYTYTGGTTTAGLRLYGDNDHPESPPWCFCYSEHDSDPARHLNLNAFDLVRVHKFPGMDNQQGTEALKALVSTDEAVRRALDEITRASSAREFDQEESAETLQRVENDYTEQSNAIRLKDTYYTRMRYSPSMDWCVWDGEIWKTGAQSYAMINVMSQADALLSEAEVALQLAPHPEKGQKKEDWDPEYKKACAMMAWAKQSRSYNNLNHTLTNARSLMLCEDANEFDRDPWLLNTPAGIVDLRTGETGPHRAEEMCTKLTACSPDRDAPHPLWDGFLDRITDGDAELRRYLQDVAGMALVGKVYEEGVVVCYGPGGNGKSTLFEIWKRVMGDYAGTVRNEVIMGARNGGEVAGQEQLRGLRLVITGELEEGQAMSNSMMKRITSRDDISCNVKYHAPITFTPTHTLVLHTNHLPKLKSVDDGTRRRLAIVPILTKIRDEEKVADFAGTVLRSEAGAVLWWMIEGAVRFFENGMKVQKPEKVRRMSEEYVNDADVLGNFLDECCEEGEDLSEANGTLFKAYCDWMEQNNAKPNLNVQTFPRALKERGFDIRKQRTGRVVQGLRLKGDFGEEVL